MAKTTVEMIEEFKLFTSFVEELKKLDEEQWNTPILEGKWTVKDVLSHIMLWDKYFYEEGIEKIKLGQPVTVRHLNFDEFNAQAIDYAKTVSIDFIIDQYYVYRNKIIDDITGLTEEDYTKDYKDGDGKKFSIRRYLRGFIPHDKHHKKQLERYMKSLSKKGSK